MRLLLVEQIQDQVQKNCKNDGSDNRNQNHSQASWSTTKRADLKPASSHELTSCPSIEIPKRLLRTATGLPPAVCPRGSHGATRGHVSPARRQGNANGSGIDISGDGKSNTGQDLFPGPPVQANLHDNDLAGDHIGGTYNCATSGISCAKQLLHGIAHAA